MLAVLGRALRLHAPHEVLERRDARAPALALLAVAQVDVLRACRCHLLAQERGEEVRHRIALDAPLDLGLRDDRRHVLAVVLVDLFGGRRDVRLGRLLLLRRGTSRARRAARRRSRGRRRSRRGSRWTMRSIVLVQRIVLAHRPATSRARPAASALTSRRDGCVFFAKNAPSSIAALSTGNLQAREQRLDAVGQILGLEDEVEQHRDHLDRHRLELVRLLAERRLLQVAQDVVHPSGIPENATCCPPTSKSVCPACRRVRPSRRSGVAMIGAPGT